MTDAQLQAQPPEAADNEASRLPADGELSFGTETMALLTHECAVSKARDGFVVVRVFGHASLDALKYIGITPKRAIRLAGRFIQAALHVDPTLYPEFEEIIQKARHGAPKKLRVVGDHAAETSPQ